MEFPLFRSQSKLFEQLRFELAPRRARLLLRGPSGAGKSHLLQTLADYHAGQGKAVIIARGEKGLVRPLQVFLRATGPASMRLATKRFVGQAADATARAVPVAGSLVGFVAQAITNDRTKTRRERLRHLRPDEFETLLHLEAIVQERDFLLVADNLQYWDGEALTLFLDMLRGNTLADDFQFLERMACVIGITDGREPANADAARAIVEHCVWTEHRLEPIERDEVGPAIVAFGGRGDVPPRELDAVYAITGGHLALLKHLAADLRAVVSAGLRSVVPSDFRASPPETLARIMALRIDATGSNAATLRTLLEAACIIGESFSRSEIACLTKFEERVLRETLEAAQRIHLLARDADRHSFTHEVVRDSLLHLLGENSREWHAALAKCLAVLRPWDYRSRAEHLDAAGDDAAAARLFFADIFQRERHEWPVTDAERNEVMARLSSTGQLHTAELLLKAHLLPRVDALRVLESIPNTEHAYFVAEKELMRGCLIMGSTRTADRTDAVHLLEDCLRLEHYEPELDTRIRLALLSGYVHLGRKPEARRVDLEISQTLGKYRRFDPACDNLLHVHHRKAATVWGAETAADRCRDAVEHFGPQNGTDLPRSPRQYFMALCNRSGNLLNCGAIDGALVAATRGIEVFRRFGSYGVADSEKCVNNLVLAALLKNEITAEDGRRLFAQSLELAGKQRRSWIHTSNLAVLAALTGDLATAERELSAARAEQIKEEVFDLYHRSVVSGINPAV